MLGTFGHLPRSICLKYCCALRAAAHIFEYYAETRLTSNFSLRCSAASSWILARSVLILYVLSSVVAQRLGVELKHLRNRSGPTRHLRCVPNGWFTAYTYQ